MLWLFQVFALTAGLCGCQVWATSSLTYDSSKITPTHVLHLGFLKRLLGVKKGTDIHSGCVLRETGQMPVFFYWFRCNSGTVYSLQTILFLRKLCGLNSLLQIEVIHGIICSARTPNFPASQHFLDARRSRKSTNLKQCELTLREHIIGGWRELDNLAPPETPIQQSYEDLSHRFGVPLGIVPGWWDDRKRNYKPALPLYLRLDIPSNLSRALSCLRLSGHNFLGYRMQKTGIEGLMSSGSVTNMTGTLFRIRNTSCWTARMNIMFASAHSTASWSSHLSMRIAQLVCRPFWTNQIVWCGLFVAECLALFGEAPVMGRSP